MSYTQPPMNRDGSVLGNRMREPLGGAASLPAKQNPPPAPGKAQGGMDVLAYTSSPSLAGARAITFGGRTSQGAVSRKTAISERYRLVISLIITALYLVLLGLMLYMSTGHASLGLTAKLDTDGKWVVSHVVPNGISYDQGIRPGDEVVSLLRQGNVELRLQGLPSNWLVDPGQESDFSDVMAVNIKKAGSPADSPYVTVDTSDKTGGSPLQRWGYAILGLIFVGVGAPVYIKARQRGAATAFYFFCIATAAALAIAPAAFLASSWVMTLMFVTIVVWSASFAYFFFKFPAQAGKIRGTQKLFMIGLAGCGALVLAAYTWLLFGHLDDYAWVQLMLYVYMAACVASGLVRLGRSLIAQRSPEVRRQLVLLLGGTAFAVGPSLFLYLLPTLLIDRALVRMEITSLTLGIMPVAFAYAITQHQLLGMRNFARRSVIYVVLGMSVLLVFSAVATLVNTIVPWERHEVGYISFGLFVFLIAISFGYAQRRVEHLVDRYLYHDAYDYKEALREFSAQLASEQNLQMLADQLVERTCRLMNLNCGVLLLSVQQGEQYKSVEPHTSSLYSPRFGSHSRRHNTTSNLAGGRNYRQGVVEGRASTAIHLPNGSESGAPLLMPYSKYGDSADWLISGLQSELSRFGINVYQSGMTAQIIHFNPIEVAPSAIRDTDHLVTTDALPNLEDPPSNDHATVSPHEGYYPDNELYAATEASLFARTTSSLSHPMEFEQIRSFLGVPLWTRSHFVGILCLGDKKTGERFAKDDLALLGTLGSQAALAIYNAQLYEAREQALLDTITALAHAIEAKDNYTINHCEKITGRAVALAQVLALPRQEVENIRLGSILHDVGKIGIPDAILNKPGKLTDDEYEIIKQHAAIGARIVQSVGALQGVVPIIRHHQERWDGTGYPDRVAGEAIPLGARIISVVDAYGAMTEDRVYRKALGHEAAVKELKRHAGKQFDPLVVGAFIRLLEDQPDLAEP